MSSTPKHTAPMPDWESFQAQLCEWVDVRLIWRHFAEALALYSVGYSARQVAADLRARDREIRRRRRLS